MQSLSGAYRSSVSPSVAAPARRRLPQRRRRRPLLVQVLLLVGVDAAALRAEAVVALVGGGGLLAALVVVHDLGVVLVLLLRVALLVAEGLVRGRVLGLLHIVTAAALVLPGQRLQRGNKYGTLYLDSDFL